MNLAPGTRLGRYEVRSKVGEGGMGEVYRATDATLRRDVAIKVLPAAFSSDPDRLRRFEQEAQAAGALNHPNILAIHDVNTQDRPAYVVSELLEGETLREHLTGAALPPRRAIDYALQITRGLAAAHEKGIIHRDLKPENLFVTRDGRVKILDFGLAKLTEAGSDNAGPAGVPTREAHTEPGTVMGTVGYMSPEQVRGNPVDHRSDIFSFGAVLYEMLSGRRAFSGESPADTISSILKEDPPDLAAAQKQVSPGLDRMVKRCLEKQREQRFHSASDLGFALEALSGIHGSDSAPIAATSEPVVSARRGLRRTPFDRAGWIIAALLLISTVALATLYLRRPAVSAKTMRFSVAAPEHGGFGDGLSLSPDGQTVAFVATGAAGVTSLWVRSLETVGARELPNTEHAALPFWSPDGRSIGFFAGNKLKKIEISGGSPQVLAEVADGRGGAWGPDGTILFAPAYTSTLYKVPAAGGAAASPATTLDGTRQQTSHRWPAFLPDGRRFLYFSRSPQKEAEGIYVGSLDSKDSQFLLKTTLLASYSPATKGSTGHLLFVRDGTLVAQSFDPDSLHLSGEPVVIGGGVLSHPGEGGPTGYAAFSASTNGHLAYLTGKQSLTQMGWFDRKGNSLGPAAPPGNYHEPSMSRDGRKIAVGRQDAEGSSDIWLLDMARGLPTRFTFDPSVDVCALWSPDGSRIVFSSSRGGKQQLYQKISSGAGVDELLLATETNAFPDDWITTRDGSFIIYEIESLKTRFDLFILPVFGDRKPFPYLQTEFNEAHSQFSPDGRWVAYVSDESGQPEVYVQPFPTTGGKWQLSTGGGDQPQWRRDGREIFYLNPQRQIVAVSVSPAVSFETGASVTLFATRVPITDMIDDRNNFIPAPDGQRFLVNNLLEDGRRHPITLVLNWAADRKQ